MQGASIFYNPAAKRVAKENLKLAKRALESVHVPYWLACGTLLGCYREGDLIGHDRDVDLGVMIDDYSPQIVPAFESEGLRLLRKFGNVDCGLEFCFERCGVTVDIFFHYSNDECTWMAVWNGSKMARYEFPHLDGLRPVDFLGQTHFVPENTRQIIERQYGNGWRIPRKQWNYFLSPDNVRHEPFRRLPPSD